MAQVVPEGWYADPQDPAPGAERWWNGYSWTAHTRQQPPPPPAPEPPAWQGAPPPAPAGPAPAYAAPAAVPAAPRHLADGTPLADLGPRLGAYAIDVVLVYTLVSVVTGVIRLVVTLADGLGVPPELWWFVGFPVKGALIALVWVGYQTLTLTRGRPTLGKKWLGLRVRPVDREGPLDTSTALRRALAGGAGPLLVLFPGSQLFGFGLAGYDAYAMQKDPLRRPWHDQLAGTAVVRTGLTAGTTRGPTP